VSAASQETAGQLLSSELLSQVQTALNSGDAAKALDLLDQFFRTSVTDLDEGWFLRGLAYESNGPSRNIRRALDAYQTLVDAFPSSPRWREARERITYINRFYFNIR
jgi:outer membrane protein assembly factor BamD (BamD/ComL family)